MAYTDKQIEKAAIFLASFNRAPGWKSEQHLTPQEYWKSWKEEAKEAFRERVRGILAIVDAWTPDSGLDDN